MPAASAPSSRSRSDSGVRSECCRQQVRASRKAAGMAVRVVVTGTDANGASKFEHDGPVAAEVVVSSANGVTMTYPWQVALPPDTVGAGHEPIESVGAFVPPPGSLNFVQFVIPPGSPAERDEAQ